MLTGWIKVEIGYNGENNHKASSFSYFLTVPQAWNFIPLGLKKKKKIVLLFSFGIQ